MARPTKLDDLTQRRITDALKAGNTRANAARMAAIAPSTLRDWERRGESGDPEFSAFSAAVKKADAEAEAAMVAVIHGAAQTGTWQAAAWFLERRRHRAWGRKDGGDRRDAERRHSAPVGTDEHRAELLSLFEAFASGDPEFKRELGARLRASGKEV